MAKTTDRAALDQWYCVDDVDDITQTARHTRLLGQDIVLRRGEKRRHPLQRGARRRRDWGRGADQGALWICLGDARHAVPRRAPHSRDRRARPALGEVRRGARSRLGLADRRELPRHGAFSLRPHRHSRRRAAHRGAALFGRDPSRRRRGLGDRLQVLPAAGLDGGEGRHHDRLHLPRRLALRRDALQDLRRLRRTAGTSSASSSSRWRRITAAPIRSCS